MITKEDVQNAAIAVVGREPTCTNPGGGCKYTVLENGVAKHCFGGQTVIELGGRVPEENDSRNTVGILALTGQSSESNEEQFFDTGLEFQYAAAAHLYELQSEADDVSNPTWASVLEKYYEGE